MASAASLHLNDLAAYYQVQSALTEALFGNFGEARKDAKEAPRATRDPDGQGMVLLALGLAGDFDEAQKLADDLSRGLPRRLPLRLPASAWTARGASAGQPAERDLKLLALPLLTTLVLLIRGTVRRCRLMCVGRRTWRHMRVRKPRGIPEDSRASRPRRERAHRGACASRTRPRLCIARRHGQGQIRLSGFSHAVEGR